MAINDSTAPISESPETTGATVSTRAAQAAHQAIDQISARSAEAELRLR